MSDTKAAPEGAHPAAIAHVTALDGLRGAAVLGVLFFHAEGLLPGGYLGVDLFFVLSGYLITSLLVSEHGKSGTVDLGRFWVRRARRLLPALLALMPGVALYAKVWAKADELLPIRKDALATLGYVANWRAIYSNKSYWDLFVAPSPLEHTWSLAIEEQFYVVWPLFAFGMLALGRTSKSVDGSPSTSSSTRTLFVGSLVLGAASVAFMALGFDPAATARVYMGTDARASGMLFGAALACVLRPEARIEGPRGRALDVLGLVSLVGLAVAWAKLDGQSPWLYRGGFFACEMACLVLIAGGVARPSGPIARLFSTAPLRAMGNISYGVYLWHWPVFIVLTPERIAAHVHLPSHLGGALLLFVARFAITLAIALVSYRFLETPIRKKGLPFGSRGTKIAVPLAFAGAFACVFLTTVPKAKAWVPAVTFDALGYPSKYSVSMRTLPPAAELRPETLRVLTLGDSVASFLGIALRHRQDDHTEFAAERGVGSCSLFESEARIVNGKRMDTTSCSTDWVTDVAAIKPDVSLIVMGGAFLAPDTCKPEFREAYLTRLRKLTDGMGKDAGQVVVTLVPYPVGRWRYGDVPQRVICLDSILSDFARERAFPTLDLMAQVCPTIECNLTSKGEPIRPDGLHFDGVGAEETASFTWKRIHEIADAKVKQRLDAAAP